MNDLETKPREEPDTSWPSDEVSASAAALSEYIDKSGRATPDPFEPGAPKYDGSEPLPSMTTSPVVTPPKSYLTASFAPYIAVALCISLAAREGVFLATSVYSGIRAEVQPATAEAEHGLAIVTAASSSPSPSADVTEESKPQPIAPEQPPLEQGQTWSKAVETFQQLLAAKTASQLEAWETRTQ